MKLLSAADRIVLSFDPWGGGKGDDPYRVLRNQIVTAKFKHRCAICFGDVAVGERHRAQTEKREDGSHQVKTFRFCDACCSAMYEAGHDDGDAICERYALGQLAAKRGRRVAA